MHSYPGARKCSPLLRELSRWAASIRIQRYRRLVRRCWFGVPTHGLPARKLEINFPVPRWVRGSCPMHLVPNRNGPNSTADGLMADDLFHFEFVQECRNVVLRDVVWRGIHGEVVEHVLRQPRQYTCFGLSSLSLGLAQGLRSVTETRWCASALGMSGGKSKYRHEGNRPMYRRKSRGHLQTFFIRPCPIERNFGLKSSASAPAFSPKRIVAAVLHTQV